MPFSLEAEIEADFQRMPHSRSFIGSVVIHDRVFDMLPVAYGGTISIL